MAKPLRRPSNDPRGHLVYKICRDPQGDGSCKVS